MLRILLLLLMASPAFAQVPTITLVSPAQSSTVPSGPLIVQFAVSNHTIGNPGQSHLAIYVDSDPVANRFHNGTTNEVLRAGAHTHFIHWSAADAAQFNGLSSGAHALRFTLADSSNADLTNIEATFTLNITVQAPVGGDLALTQVVPGLNFPIAMAFAADGRLFYTEKGGNTRVMNYNAGPQTFSLQTAVVFNVSVNTASERGLLGVCLDPNFAINGYLYCYYTTSVSPHNRVSRFTISNSGGNWVGTSEFIVLDNIANDAGNHNGGNIHFGPDGFLYVSVGDGGATAANSQNANNMLGKILRINPATGAAASGNPSFGGTEARLWCMGLRNSFDFCFHGDTGDLWASENGPGSDDEVNRIVAGSNYGWPTVTGIAGNPSFVDPIAEYTPTIAPTGIMAISDNANYPPAYHHNLLMSDFNNGQIRRYILTGPTLSQLGGQTIAYTGGNGGITDVEEAPNGWVYVFAGSGPGTGALYRLDMNNSAPTILSTPPANAYVGVNYSYTIQAAGSPTIAYSVSGQPAWLTLSGNTLSGTPNAADLGVTGNITITATNGVGNDMQVFTINVQVNSAAGNGGEDKGGCSTAAGMAPWLALAAICGLLAAWRTRRTST
jgi:glucose/arabinose dehydrogenase